VYFGLPDDALALRDGLREVLSTACTPVTIRAAWSGSACESLWKELGAYGILGLLAPDAEGGLGLDELSFVAAMEECGYSGVPGPLVESVVMAHRLGLPLDGSARVAICDARQPVVPYAAGATHVFDADARQLLSDVVTTPVATVDASRQAARVSGKPTGEPLTGLGQAWQLAMLGTAAFLLGLARRQRDITVAYAKERTQFGVAIGTFQAIKHPLADAVVGTELAWPVVLHAAHALATGAPDARLRVAHAKAAASDASYRVSRVCLQAHGAIGYTVEYDLHLFMKRTWALAADWGSAADHRTTIAKELLR
jgi:alkylation response protein AidB-like acyl-CoA dehydrogenase